jgi:hypothetical protein
MFLFLYISYCELVAKRIITIAISTATATATDVSLIAIAGETNNLEDTFMILEEVTPYRLR